VKYLSLMSLFDFLFRQKQINISKHLSFLYFQLQMKETTSQKFYVFRVNLQFGVLKNQNEND